jgi:hypothetical protein
MAATSSGRSPYRDNDDQRDPLDANERTGTRPDTKNEARGDARKARGDHARGTDTNPTGPEGNDNQRSREDFPRSRR